MTAAPDQTVAPDQPAAPAQTPADVVTVGQYLARRLIELGGPHVFGLPGDFNLTLLDEMLTVPGLEWVGTTNELNAAYAADAYARTSRGVAAIVTTYGVGELSAINGIAGSFAEDVPVVQIAGMPTTTARTNGALSHHTLVDGDYDHFFRAYKEVTVAGAILRAADATRDIDRVLRAALDESKPVYLGIPMDIAASPVSSAPLRHPLRATPSDPVALDDFRRALAEAVAGAGRHPITILAGPRIHRRRAEATLERLADHAGVRVATQASAKSMLPETHPASLGIYMGQMTPSPETRAAVDGAPLVILAGTVLSDVLTGFYSMGFDVDTAVELGVSSARVGAVTFHDVRLEDSLRAVEELVSTLDRGPAGAVTPRYPYRPDQGGAPAPAPSADEQGDSPLTQHELWTIVQEWLPTDSIAIADAGTAMYGALELQMPEGTDLLAQPIWSSIGYTLPATLGTSLASERRSVLFIGDGAAQLTATELATILHRGLTPIIVLINNDGYTIERVIQSPRAVYQGITRWDWQALPAALAPGVDVVTASATTAQELRDALTAAAEAADRAVLIQAYLDPDDAPPLLAALGAIAGGGVPPKR
ncbi:alpha-keto acid decarboxylase family protein [Frondihabitans australicus]|uniref:Alpha-keto-acid decarboxylase n=1 Tax=Frondihabitans australicus TaxID=386892 RepID=A0A495IHR4_9MICO|nr:thiamine pyrophosphate-binding protein [Frondihabitans australicus]RKR74646.1 indolepyruvate decarboxylase [Frondihabitans australicus]